MSEKIGGNNSLSKDNQQVNNFKKPLTLNLDMPTNKIPNKQMSTQNKGKNQNIVDIENILKHASNIGIKKNSNHNFDKKLNYLKYKNIPQLSENNQQNNNHLLSNKIRKLSTGNIDTSLNEDKKVSKTRIYEEIIKKNMPKNNNNIYYKYTNRNMSFQLKKNFKANEETIKSPLESLRSRGSYKNALNNNNKKLNNNQLDYQKFKNVFLIINDSVSISTNSLVKNTNNNFMKFLSFLNNNEILHLFSLNRELRSSIIGCLAYKVKEKILPDFTRYYCKDILFNNDYNFMISSKIYKKHKLIIRFILSIRPRITKTNKKIVNKRFKIGFYEYVKNKINKNEDNNNNDNQNQIQQKKTKEKIFTTYIFEIIDKLHPKNFWVFKENTTFHYDENNKAYYNDIMQFRLGDNALINMSLISELGIIDFDNIFWFKAKMETIKEIKTHKCEVENMIFEWNKIVLLDKGEIVKKNLNELFSDNFIIKDIYYDDVGYFFFKVILQAYKVGICSGKEGNLGVKIHILPINSSITNEIKKNGLVYDENNELAINVGDVITFYISQNKM